MPGVARLSTALFDRFSSYHLSRGLDLLSAGRVVVTDRLHAHILCLLLGIPHVVLDNSYGKVHGFLDTWTKGSSLVHKAANPQEAAEIAKALLERLNDDIASS